MLPVQSYSCKSLIAANENSFLGVPCSCEIFAVKKSTNKGISFLLSFKEGTLIKITANL